MKQDVFSNVYYYTVCSTVIGDVGIVWWYRERKEMVCEITLPQTGRKTGNYIKRSYPDVGPSSSSMVDTLCGKIQRYLDGERITFSIRNIDTEVLNKFQHKVLMMERRIPYGWVSTYGRLAQKIGNRGAARAVGSALARNPFPIIMPCHRTIRSDMTLGGYQGGVQLKRHLLEMEGGHFDKKGRVANTQFW